MAGFFVEVIQVRAGHSRISLIQPKTEALCELTAHWLVGNAVDEPPDPARQYQSGLIRPDRKTRVHRTREAEPR